MALILVLAIAALLALAARAGAAPPDDPEELAETTDLGDEPDPELDEAIAQPEIVDEPTTDEAIAQLEPLGLAGVAGAEDWLETQARHQRPSPWGRLDLQLALLHRDDAPGLTMPHRFDELWVELIWRR